MPVGGVISGPAAAIGRTPSPYLSDAMMRGRSGGRKGPHERAPALVADFYAIDTVTGTGLRSRSATGLVACVYSHSSSSSARGASASTV